MNIKEYSVKELSEMYKYTIWGKWQNFTKAEQMTMKIELPKLIGVCWRTIENWMYYRVDDNKFVPADKLFQLSTFFEVPFYKMWNNPPTNLSGELQRIKLESKL